MKYIVNFSGGVCSFWAAHRTIWEHGKNNVIPLFADTLYESKDLYEFNAKAEEILGLEIIRITKGMTPWELFQSEGMIANPRFPICSTKLKRELLNWWMEANYEMNLHQDNLFKEHAVVVLGFDWNEAHRVSDFQAQHPAWTVEAPMLNAPIWDKCKMLKECEELGFKTPLLYQLGFPHNNCGGFCVKAGISHFIHLYRMLPDVYLQNEVLELQTQERLKSRGVSNWQFTVLKDRRGGATKPLSLKELRQRIEANDPDLPKDDWGGCGCGGATR
jgi:hypothetical protein